MKWTNEISALRAEVESLRNGDLRKKHDYYTAKLDELTKKYEKMSATQEGLAELSERIDRNAEKLREAASRYYQATEQLVSMTNEASNAAVTTMDGLIHKFIGLQELFAAAFSRLSSMAAMDADEKSADPEDIKHEILSALGRVVPKCYEGSYGNELPSLQNLQFITDHTATRASEAPWVDHVELRFCDSPGGLYISVARRGQLQARPRADVQVQAQFT